MEFTGERYTPEIHGNIELEHVHRYLLASEITSGKEVLDIASGEGFGSAILAGNAKKVTGVDISAEAVEHANEKYKSKKLEFRVGSCAEIPLPDASVDLVVSFETIEHHDQHEEMMNEIKRVLRADGVLLISSPDKANYTDKPGFNNPFHVKELYKKQFTDLINEHFTHSLIYGQRIIYSSSIFSEADCTEIVSYEKKDSTIDRARGLPDPLYNLALASDGQLPDLFSSIFEQPIDESETVQAWAKLAAERQETIKSLSIKQTTDEKTIQELNVQLEERGKVIMELNVQLEERGKVIMELNDQLTAKEKILSDLHQQLTERERIILEVNNQLTEREKIVLSLNSQLADDKRALIKLNDQLTDYSEVIAALNEQITSLKELRNIIAEKETILTDLNQRLVQETQKTKKLNQQIDQKEQIINEITAEVEKVKLELEQVTIEIVDHELSKSWRITRPLRKIAKIFKGN